MHCSELARAIAMCQRLVHLPIVSPEAVQRSPNGAGVDREFDHSLPNAL